MHDPLSTSGITYEEFCGAFGWIIIPLNTMNEALQSKWNQARDLTVRFRSNHNAVLQAHCWVMSEEDFSLDISTGKLISK